MNPRLRVLLIAVLALSALLAPAAAEARDLLATTVSAPSNGKSKRERVRPGYFFARYAIKLPNGTSDVRRKVFRLKGGRFTARPDFYRRESCALLRSYTLERAAFGGSTQRPLRAAFRLTRAPTVQIQVLRGTKVVKTIVKSRRFAANLTQRATLSAKGLRRGDYKVRRAGSRTTTSTLTTRKL